jgi:hypothetical protein
VFVVITKIDMCRKFVIQKCVTQLEKILKGPGCKKISVRIESEDDAITAAQNFDSEKYVNIFQEKWTNRYVLYGNLIQNTFSFVLMIVHRFYLYSLYHFVSTYFILQS